MQHRIHIAYTENQTANSKHKGIASKSVLRISASNSNTYTLNKCSKSVLQIAKSKHNELSTNVIGSSKREPNITQQYQQSNQSKQEYQKKKSNTQNQNPFHSS